MNEFILDISPLLVLLAISIQILVILGRKKMEWKILKLLKYVPTFILAVMGISLYLDSKSSSDGLSSMGFFYSSLLFGFSSLISLVIGVFIKTK